MKSSDRKALILERRTDLHEKIRLWCKNGWRYFDVYDVPVEALMPNVDNHRFQAERKLIEHKLGRSLDPENIPEDINGVISILLDNCDVEGDRIVGKPTKDTEALTNDWLNRGQETPFWIRPDGTVRNGNRRLAMIKRLRVERGADGRELVKAIILDPQEVSEHDLFEMEQREQLTENLKVRYTDVNLLLTLRAAAESRTIDWSDPDSIERVAGELQYAAKGDKQYAAVQLRAIKYMDLFLVDGGKPGEYETLIGTVEVFRDIGKLMLYMENNYEDEAPDMLRLAFAFIRAHARYGEVRSLKKIFVEDRARFRKMSDSILKDEADWEQAAGSSRLEEPAIVMRPEETNGDEDEEREHGPVIPNYPEDRIKTRIRNAIDAFNASKLTNVASILEQAIERLEILDHQKLKAAIEADESGEISTMLQRLIKWADDTRAVVESSTQGK